LVLTNIVSALPRSIREEPLAHKIHKLGNPWDATPPPAGQNMNEIKAGGTYSSMTPPGGGGPDCSAHSPGGEEGDECMVDENG
ncbi:unnamed protein product, partial [marine sediment metagenome]